MTPGHTAVPVRFPGGLARGQGPRPTGPVFARCLLPALQPPPHLLTTLPRNTGWGRTVRLPPSPTSLGCGGLEWEIVFGKFGDVIFCPEQGE